jgi:hypothetical protein
VHKPDGPEVTTDQCPWCGSKISRAEFQRIRDQIAEQERGRLARVEQTLRQQFGAEQQKAMAAAKAEVDGAIMGLERFIERLPDYETATIEEKADPSEAHTTIDELNALQHALEGCRQACRYHLTTKVKIVQG